MTERQKERQKERQRQRETERGREREGGREGDRETERQRQREGERERERERGRGREGVNTIFFIFERQNINIHLYEAHILYIPSSVLSCIIYITYKHCIKTNSITM